MHGTLNSLKDRIENRMKGRIMNQEIDGEKYLESIKPIEFDGFRKPFCLKKMGQKCSIEKVVE